MRGGCGLRVYSNVVPECKCSVRYSVSLECVRLMRDVADDVLKEM